MLCIGVIIGLILSSIAALFFISQIIYMLYFWIEDITIYERSRELVINRILPEKMEITAVDGVESIFVYFFAILGLFAASLVWFISVPVGLLILLLFILRKARRKMKGM